jgi:hypothetical protein
LLGLLGAAVAAGAVPTGANAGGTNTWLCGQTHHGAYEWTVEAILSTSEDAHPDVTCAQARKTVAAIDGGKGTGVKRSSSPASGQAEIVYGKWTCTIAQGGAKATFMARKVQGRQSWVTCYDGVDVDGVDDAIAYSYGVEPQIPS